MKKIIILTASILSGCAYHTIQDKTYSDITKINIPIITIIDIDF